MKKKIIGIFVVTLLIATALPVLGINNNEIAPLEKNIKAIIYHEDPKPFGFILVFGASVDVKLEPGEDYVDLEILNKAFYIWDQEIITFNPGVFLRLYEAKGLFIPALPFCIGICSDYGIIG